MDIIENRGNNDNNNTVDNEFPTAPSKKSTYVNNEWNQSILN